MLKGNSKDITFEELMRQAAKVAQAQDAVLEEKAKERRRKEQDERQYKVEKRQKEPALQELERRDDLLLRQQKRQDTISHKLSSQRPLTEVKKTTSANLVKSSLPTPVHIPYEQLMDKSREASIPKRTSPNVKDLDQRQTTATAGSSKPTSTLYIKRPTTQKPKPPSAQPPTVHARDRIRLLFNAPAQKVFRPKRDRQSIEEIQREIRHSKGIYSDDEDQVKKKTIRRNNHQASKTLPTTTKPSPQLLRMPFRRAVDLKRDVHTRKRRLEEEEEEDLDSFVVQDETVDDYSSEISKLFRYDRTKYANESVYSDDDMEANSMDVIREEDQSARLARREDQLEEQIELERRKKRLARSKGR